MSDRILVGTRKGFFSIRRHGRGDWRVERTEFLGVECSLALDDPRTGALYAALDHGHFGRKLHRAAGHGEAFEEIAAPAYPPKPEDAKDEDPNQRKRIDWAVKGIWSLETGGADQPGRLWCGTTPGGLFRSDDGGDSWELVRSLWDMPERAEWFGGGTDVPALHSVCVDPRDSKRVLIAVSCGGAWLTEDDGATWAVRAQGMRADFMPPERQFDPNVQDPHCVVQCAADPETFWCQHHCGVFVSRDGAKSWKELETPKPSVFGFAVAVHPKDPKTAWFVPAIKDEARYPVDGKVVVSRTRDGGESFEVLSNGLPQQHAYDLTFRHALDVDGEGERLAFGSTTGALWVSENGGDDWDTISTHLPPVYSVRFARA